MSADFPTSAQAWIASRASKETRAAYARDLQLWLEHCKGAGANPGDPGPAAVVGFRGWLQETRAPLSVRRILATLSAVFVAVQPGKPNPFSLKALPRPPASTYARTQAVAKEDARRILAAAAERGEAPLRDVALLRVLWSTGMRRSSAASIRRDDIVRLKDGVVVRYIIKGGKEVESELPADAVHAIDAWLEVAPRSKWLFCVLDGSRAISPQAVTNIVAGASRAAGRHVHPHMFRSAAATDLLDANVPLEQVQAFLHHADPRSTLRYDRGRRAAGVAAKLAAYREKE